MTRDKAQKRATRARMSKTGERYTTARHFALDLHQTDQRPQTTATADDSRPDMRAAHLAAAITEPRSAETALLSLSPRVAEPGVSEAAVMRSTGKSWDEWLALLDTWGAAEHGHTATARHVAETLGISGWWAQSVTVGYERARGLRAVHERPDGFLVSVSKTFPVSVERLFAAFVVEDERARWLDGLTLRQRTSNPHTTARFDIEPDGERLAVTFVARGPEKATAALQIERLTSANDVERWRAIWNGHLARLGAYLAHGADGPS